MVERPATRLRRLLHAGGFTDNWLPWAIFFGVLVAALVKWWL